MYLSEWCFGVHVAVAHGGHGDGGPPKTLWDAFEGRAHLVQGSAIWDPGFCVTESQFPGLIPGNLGFIADP